VLLYRILFCRGDSIKLNKHRLQFWWKGRCYRCGGVGLTPSYRAITVVHTPKISKVTRYWFFFCMIVRGQEIGKEGRAARKPCQCSLRFLNYDHMPLFSLQPRLDDTPPPLCRAMRRASERGGRGMLVRIVHKIVRGISPCICACAQHGLGLCRSRQLQFLPHHL
jgi:hypothetical protein